jgi:hypothetical protein
MPQSSRNQGAILAPRYRYRRCALDNSAVFPDSNERIAHEALVIPRRQSESGDLITGRNL